ncbi:unnamed protein product [Pleuronectes platessa]|uniref:Uncharacterized protein n=1 Tax=Pleuronectes platessa TaxID=8262 RepID=A0A9N7Z3Q0_PLEPL|nr:unnamed protein product [Pleuronectes platessa]
MLKQCGYIDGSKQVGQEILANLHTDREKIQRARERLRETDANLGKSSRILTGMLRSVKRVALHSTLQKLKLEKTVLTINADLQHSNKTLFYTITSPNALGSTSHDIEVMLRLTLFIPSWLIELHPPPSLTLTDCRSDEMTGDQWRSHPLKWLQVSLQGYPPCLICRRAPVGPRHPLISPSEGKEALLSKSSTATFE